MLKAARNQALNATLKASLAGNAPTTGLCTLAACWRFCVASAMIKAIDGNGDPVNRTMRGKFDALCVNWRNDRIAAEISSHPQLGVSTNRPPTGTEKHVKNIRGGHKTFRSPRLREHNTIQKLQGEPTELSDEVHRCNGEQDRVNEKDAAEDASKCCKKNFRYFLCPVPVHDAPKSR
jgi:hypothetical protein